jgi:phage terminase Nu1 subunit (DNA packaging protein)
MSAVMLSISQLSTELELTRETVRKRLGDGGVKTAGKRKGYALYRLRDAVRAVLTGADADPTKLDPFRRKAHWQAEAAELRLDVDKGELVRVTDLEQVYAATMKPIALMLDTLPDVLERDAGLNAQQVSRAERAIDETRELLVGLLQKDLTRVRKSR